MQSIRTHSMFTPRVNMTFSLLTLNDIEEAAECLTHSFTQSEPMTKTLNVTENEFMVFSKFICQKAVEHGLSLIVRDKDNNNLIGFSIIEPAGIQYADMPSLSEKFLPIFALLENVLAPLKSPENAVHYFTLAINKKYQQQGLAKLLIASQLYFLSQSGYHYFCAEVTNPLSHQALLSVLSDNFSQANTIDYQSFIYEHKHPFANLPGSATGCITSLHTLKPHFKEWAKSQSIEINSKQLCRL